MEQIQNAINGFCNKVLKDPEELLRQFAWVIASREDSDDFLWSCPKFLEEALRPHVMSAKTELGRRK